MTSPRRTRTGRRPRGPFAALAFLLLLSPSCSQDGGSPTDWGDDKGTGAVTRTIPTAGGLITASTGEGVTVTLEFPSGAVRVPTAVTLRPVAPAAGAVFAVQLEPAGMVFYNAFEIRVKLPKEIALTGQHLFLGSPGDPIIVPTTVDATDRTLSTALWSFGFFGESVVVPASPEGRGGATMLQSGGTNTLGAMTQSCQQILAQAQADFDALVNDENYEQAIAAALSAASTLQNASCPGAQDWIDAAADLACQRLEAAITDAQSTSIAAFGDFEK